MNETKKGNMEILEWSYALQLTLQQMSDKEFKAFMKGKAIRFEGKLYGTETKKKTKKEIQ